MIACNTRLLLRAYPRTLWKGASGPEILNNQTVLGHALNYTKARAFFVQEAIALNHRPLLRVPLTNKRKIP